MTDCDDDSLDRESPILGDGGGLWTPDDEDGQLVTVASEKRDLTMRAEYDEHTAVVRGLAAYVSQLESAVVGRGISFSRVVADWADREDGSVRSPSAAVYSTEIGQYQTDSGMAPGAPRLVDTDYGDPSKVTQLALTCSGMYTLSELMVEAKCEDKVQRVGVRRMLVDAFWPVQWMSGFRLFLPRYHSAIAEYLLVSGQQSDAADTAGAGIRPLTMRLRVRVPVYRMHRMVLARPVAVGTIGLGNRRT